MKKYQIGIIGSAGKEEYSLKKPSTNIYLIAYELGKLVAKSGNILVTGGKGGIMQYASKGAKEVGGTTVGFVKGKERFTANKYVDFEVVSGMEGCGEETMLILSCDGLIGIGGGAGTLQELSIAYRNSKPVVLMDTEKGWSKILANSYLDERKTTKFEKANNPNSAFKKLIRLIEKQNVRIKRYGQ